MTGPALRVALHQGVLLRHDAISTSLLRKLRILRRLASVGVPVEVTALAAYADVDERGVQVVPRVWDLVAHPAFRRADLHVWEYGIWYPGFDAVFATPAGAANLAIFHNVTPPALAADAETRGVLERSLDRRSTLSVMHHVACDSEYNRADLVALGLDPARLSVVALPPGQPPRRDLRRPRRLGEPIRLLFVGRLAAAKGLRELMEAAAGAVSTCPPFTLDIVGNLTFSGPATVAWLRQRIGDDDLSRVVRLVGELEDDELAAAYAAADAFVLPSHHEGFCVPVIEALAAGCAVVTSTAGNLPDVVGGLGWTVPVGDVDALQAALVDVVTRLSAADRGMEVRLPSPDGDLPLGRWTGSVDRHLERYGEPAYETGFLRAVCSALEAAGAHVAGWARERAA